MRRRRQADGREASALRAPDGVRIATPNVPLVILGPGQSIDATVHTRVAGGGEHARFCPAEIAGYARAPRA